MTPTTTLVISNVGQTITAMAQNDAVQMAVELNALNRRSRVLVSTSKVFKFINQLSWEYRLKRSTSLNALLMVVLRPSSVGQAMSVGVSMNLAKKKVEREPQLDGQIVKFRRDWIVARFSVKNVNTDMF